MNVHEGDFVDHFLDRIIRTNAFPNPTYSSKNLIIFFLKFFFYVFIQQVKFERDLHEKQ